VQGVLTGIAPLADPAGLLCFLGMGLAIDRFV
jgi:hypothetical protein